MIHQLFSINSSSPYYYQQLPNSYPTLLFLDKHILAYRKQQQYYPFFLASEKCKYESGYNHFWWVSFTLINQALVFHIYVM